MVSKKGYPTTKSPDPTSDKGHAAGHGYYCMMFEYYITTESIHEDTEMVKTKEVFFSCDTENLCKDAQMFEGYEVNKCTCNNFYG